MDRWLHTNFARKKWRLLSGLFFENTPFLREFMRFSWKLRLREDRGENPLVLKVCLRSTDEAGNQNCDVVQKRSVVWKSPPDSGTVDSDWYGLCFNLAQFNYFPFFLARFGMRELCACFSRHVRLHSSCLSVLEYCAGVRMDTPRELSKCIWTVRKIEQLLCLSFRSCFVYCRPNKPCKMEACEIVDVLYMCR